LKPTVRDLADSAGDLRTYAERFRQIASRGDPKGDVTLKSSMLVKAGEFFDAVADELVSLIGEHPAEEPLPTPPRKFSGSPPD
jgi:hypothetical protein